MSTRGATVVQDAAWTEHDGILVSPLLSSLGLAAGFTTRSLGSMGGRETPPEEARSNKASLARRLGFEEVVRAKQVHRDRILYAPFVRPGTVSPAPAVPHGEAPEADGVWTDRPGVLLGIVAADCVPVLLADGDGRIGAAHAGWEGTSRGIARHLVAALRAAGARPARLAAAIGPSIGPCCYVVGHDRADLVRERLGALADGAIVERDGAVVLDLWRANVEQLRAEGVGTIEVAGVCTKSGGAGLWSHRGGDVGRLGLAFIGRTTRGASPPRSPRSAEDVP